jgi:hypothetical protein
VERSAAERPSRRRGQLLLARVVGVSLALAPEVARAAAPPDSGAPVAPPPETAAPPSASALAPAPTAAPPLTAPVTPALNLPPLAPPPSPSAPALPAPATVELEGHHVPRVIGLAVGWSWNTVNRLPVALDGKKTQPHGLSASGDFLWQVGGIGGGWPSFIGFLTGFEYFPGSDVRRDAYALGYGILVRHGLFPGNTLRPFVAYGLGATQAWVKGVESRGIGHLTRLSLGTDVVLSPRFSLSFELLYKIVNIPTFAAAGSSPPPSYDFHTLSALVGARYRL